MLSCLIVVVGKDLWMKLFVTAAAILFQDIGMNVLRSEFLFQSFEIASPRKTSEEAIIIPISVYPIFPSMRDNRQSLFLRSMGAPYLHAFRDFLFTPCSCGCWAPFHRTPPLMAMSFV